MKKVCLDPGHGGIDPGAIGTTGLKESEVVLVMGLLISAFLWREGVEVFLTRKDNTFLELRERVDLAEQEGCDIFISIHTNAHSSLQAHGVETFHLPSSTQGQILAEYIHNGLVKGTGMSDRGIKRANFTVLTGTFPSVLIEAGFITNPLEEKMMVDPDWLVFFSREIAQSVMDYLEEEGGE